MKNASTPRQAAGGGPGRIGSILFTYGILIFVFGISLFPILWVVMSSFKGNAAILGSPFALPETISFKAYAEVFTQYDFQIYTLNSFIISSVATLVWFTCPWAWRCRCSFSGRHSPGYRRN